VSFSILRNSNTYASLFLSEDASLEENIRLKDALELDEKKAHESVKLLLRKYERFRVKSVCRFNARCIVVDNNEHNSVILMWCDVQLFNVHETETEKN